jgi:hypothetical protein
MAAGNDIKGATDTYGGFLTIMKIGTAAAVLAAIVVVLLIAS